MSAGSSGARIEMEEEGMKRLVKNRFNVLLLAAAAVLVLAAISAHAQLTGTIEANVPFTFTAGSAKLPAGSYTIRVLDINDPHVLEIADTNRKVEILVNAEAATGDLAPTRTELEFDKIGNREFLSKIWLRGERDGYQLEKSRMQMKLEKDGAKPQSHRVPANQKAKSTS
jgi:hypothetical protein